MFKRGQLLVCSDQSVRCEAAQLRGAIDLLKTGQKFRLGKIQKFELPRESGLLNTYMMNYAIVPLWMVELKICDGKLSFLGVIIFSFWDSNFNFLWYRGLGTQGDNIVCGIVTAQGITYVYLWHYLIIPNIIKSVLFHKEDIMVARRIWGLEFLDSSQYVETRLEHDSKEMNIESC